MPSLSLHSGVGKQAGTAVTVGWPGVLSVSNSAFEDLTGADSNGGMPAAGAIYGEYWGTAAARCRARMVQGSGWGYQAARGDMQYAQCGGTQ